jgi:nickel-dependent lactate racemase
MLSVGYGDGSLDFELPEDWRSSILVPTGMPSLDDPAGEVAKAIGNPVSSPPIGEVLEGAGNLVIVVSDKTRVTGADIVLPVLIDAANDAGIPDAGITVLFACGTHAMHTEKERRAIVGESVAARVRLVDHDCRDGDLVSVGTTTAGTQVRINRMAYEADRLLITGTVQFHYFAGFGGGRKSVLPGICAEETIIRNHTFTMSPEGGRNPNCRPGRLDGNELSEDMAEAARLVSPDFLVNVVLNGRREIAGVFAGDWDKAHREACGVVASKFGVRIGEKADLVVASPGGYPKDINYIQSHKAYDNAFHAVKSDGTIILAAECRDGLGNEILAEYLAIPTIEEHEKRLKDHFQISGHTALAHRLKARAVHTIVVTDMKDDEAALLGVERASDVADALEKAKPNVTSGRPLTYVMPEGYGTLPQLA